MAQQWMIRRGDKEYGPVSLEKLRSLAEAGKLKPHHLVRLGNGQWQKAEWVKGLFAAQTTVHPPGGPSQANSTTGPTDEPPNAASFGDWYKSKWMSQQTVAVQIVLWLLYGWLWIPTWFLFSSDASKKQKSWIAGGIGVFVLIGLLASPNASESRRSAANGSTPASDSESAAGNGLGVGDEFQLGDYKYVVTQFQTRPFIGGSFQSENASSGATFVIIHYTIENLTNESQTVLSDDFKLQDFKGRTFSPSSDATTALMMESSDKDFILSEVQPGIVRAMQTAFEVPLESTEHNLTLVVPEKGLWSSGEAKVTLTGS